MAAYKWLNAEITEKIWKLHSHGMNTYEISKMFEISRQSVLRIVNAFKLAEIGDIDGLRNVANPSHARLAAKYFGIDEGLLNPQEKPEALPEAEEKPVQIDDNTGEYLLQMLAEIKRTNELLEKLCSAWGE